MVDLRLHQPAAQVFVPDGVALGPALARASRVGVGAHQDDLEIMAYHGILACYQGESPGFVGVVCTTGADSPRSGPYGGYTASAMAHVRQEEQNEAARVGRYAAMIQLAYPSSTVKSSDNELLEHDLAALFEAMSASVVYVHNPADRHETHVAVSLRTIRALRRLPRGRRPEAVYGCEVWGSLDWLEASDKVVLDLRGPSELGRRLLEVHQSQVSGGKRYDLATIGRRLANATFDESHRVDKSDEAWLAVDLTPLVRDESLDIIAFVQERLERFRAGTIGRIRRHLDAP